MNPWKWSVIYPNIPFLCGRFFPWWKIHLNSGMIHTWLWFFFRLGEPGKMEVIPFFSSIVEMFQDMFDAKDDSSATFEEVGQLAWHSEISGFRNFHVFFPSKGLLKEKDIRHQYLTPSLFFANFCQKPTDFWLCRKYCQMRLDASLDICFHSRILFFQSQTGQVTSQHDLGPPEGITLVLTWEHLWWEKLVWQFAMVWGRWVLMGFPAQKQQPVFQSLWIGLKFSPEW